MKKSKEPTLGDFLTDIEGLLKDFKKIQEGNITTKDLENIDKNNTKFNYPVLKVSKQNQRRLFQVEEHDGRHRAIALLLLGYTHMPVSIIITTKDSIRNSDIIMSENKKYDTEIENKKYWTKWVVPNQIDITSKEIIYLMNIFESIQQNANALKSLLK